ncbi:MAG: protein kinase, partial [Gemmatimonadales bacterium]
RLRTDRLRELLATSPLSQNNWAIRMGFSRGHWSDLVNGRHPYPSPKTRARMLELLTVPFDELFEIETGAPAAGADFPAAVADRYLIDRELGPGAMGTVFLARDLARGRPVAIKVIAPEAVSGIGLESFEREIGFMAQLDHPHIVPLHDSGVAAGNPYYVMPWVRDGSLRDRLRRDGRLPLDVAIGLVRGIAAALTYAHTRQVLHCDVKPENILLYGAHPYVMDFGIGRAIHAEASEWRARRGLDLSAGTPAYVSPEQANGDLDLDGRSDVYSLGCVVYEMLTGRPPFEGTSTEAVVARRFLGDPPPIRGVAPEVPEAVAELVTQAMALDRNRRPPTPEVFATALGAAASAASPLAVRASLALTRATDRWRRAGRSAPTRRLGGLVSTLWQDLRLAARTLRRSPGFALMVVLPLALGLGAGATFFGVVDRFLLRPPPGVADPGRVVRFVFEGDREPAGRFVTGGLTWPDHEVLAQEPTTFSAVGSWLRYAASLGRGPDARNIPVALATASLFPALGIKPARGRFYSADEDVVGNPNLPCVASDRFWRRTLARSDSLGQRFRIGQLDCTIVGVTPPHFEGADLAPVDLWIPLRGGAVDFQGPDPALWTTDRYRWLRTVARLAPGVDRRRASQVAALAYRKFPSRVRDPDLTGLLRAEPLLEARGTEARGNALPTAAWLTGAATVLLLLTAVNLLNLFLARSLSRSREHALRLALGGGAGALVRAQVAETGLLALLAGGAALALVALAGPLARATLFPAIRWAEDPLDWRSAAVAIGLALVIGLSIAVATGLAARRTDAGLLFRLGSIRLTGGRGTHRRRLGLVALQAALSALLLVGSLGFVRSFRRTANLDLGFDPAGLLIADVPTGAFADPDRHRRFLESLEERARATPGVVEAALGYMAPWSNNRTEPVVIPGRDSLPRAEPFGVPVFDAVTPDYQRTMRLQLLAGRWITAADAAGSAPVVVVNQALARLYWPAAASVIGRCLRIGAGSPPCREIVGVVADHRFSGGIDSPPIAAYFVPHAQAAAYQFTPKLFLRTAGDAARFQPVVQRLVQGGGADLPAVSIRTAESLFEPLVAPARVGAVAFTALGVLSLIVALAGLVAVLSFLVAERSAEFAIRSALGGAPRQVAAPVVRQAVIVVGVGTAAGLAFAALAARWVQPLLYEVRLLDPLVVGGLAAGFGCLAALAALGPARRAAARQPMEVLRAE